MGYWKGTSFGCKGLLAAMLGMVVLALPSPALAAFGFESLSSTIGVAGGTAGALPAGSHPESWTMAVAFNSVGPPGERRPEGDLKDLRVELPVGLVAVPVLFPQCSHVAFLEDVCPASTAVGSIEFASGEPLPPSTLYLLEPTAGEAAQLGFHASTIPATIDISISSQPPYRLIASTTNVPQVTELSGASLRLEGTPGGKAFLVLPRGCTAPMQAGFTASSWQNPGATALGVAPEPQSLVDCDSLAYAPSLEVAPTTTDIASPSGLDISFDALDPGISVATGRASADTRSATLALPPGMTINPAVAAGLGACTPAELAAEGPDAEPGQGCPQSSKLGTAAVTTPLFSEAIKGAIYLARPEGADSAIVTDASGSRLTLDLVFSDAERGVLLALPLDVDVDAGSGDLTASLEEAPQLPISNLELHLNSGPRAPLTTPGTCGSHSIGFSLAPSSGNPPSSGSRSFTSASSECSPGFAPAFQAGSVSTAAGRSSAFVFELSQGAAAPDLSGVSLTLPPGLSASFAAVPPCPESRVAGGDCPVASKLGFARVALGSGSEPLWIPAGQEPDSAVYLAGPYKGAPYSLLIVVPARGGPFDLGTVILRAPVTVDPSTAQAGLSVEGLPQTLAGVPLQYRALRVVLDRLGFIHNPTSCEPMALTGTATAANGRTAELATRFQASDCAALAFRPKLSLRFSGALGRNGHPALRAVLGTDPEGAALKSARFSLPAGELLDLRHVRRLCPRTVAAGNCPPASRLGSVRLYSPSLEAPLEGPVYLRVPSHRLPDLVGDLRSGELHFFLGGRTTLAKGRVGIALESLPDVPLSRAILDLAGGRRGILVNSRSLCEGIGAVTAHLGAHNGRRRYLHIRPRHPADCSAPRK